MGYVIEENDVTLEVITDGATMQVPRGGQICSDTLVEELVRQTLDSSKSEIGMLKNLTMKQEVKIEGQTAQISKLKAKIADLKSKNTGLIAKYAGKDDELAQQRVKSEALKAEITKLNATLQEREAVVKSLKEQIYQKRSLDKAKDDEIAQLQNQLDQINGENRKAKESLKGTENDLSVAKELITRMKTQPEKSLTGNVKNEIESKQERKDA